MKRFQCWRGRLPRKRRRGNAGSGLREALGYDVRRKALLCRCNRFDTHGDDADISLLHGSVIFRRAVQRRMEDRVMLTGLRKTLVAAGVAAACLLPMAKPALAWRTGVVVGIGIPAPVFVAPPVVVRPPVVVVHRAYAPLPPRWVPGHYNWRGFWIPGHWV